MCLRRTGDHPRERLCRICKHLSVCLSVCLFNKCKLSYYDFNQFKKFKKFGRGTAARHGLHQRAVGVSVGEIGAAVNRGVGVALIGAMRIPTPLCFYTHAALPVWVLRDRPHNPPPRCFATAALPIACLGLCIRSTPPRRAPSRWTESFKRAGARDNLLGQGVNKTSRLLL